MAVCICSVENKREKEESFIREKKKISKYYFGGEMSQRTDAALEGSVMSNVSNVKNTIYIDRHRLGGRFLSFFPLCTR